MVRRFCLLTTLVCALVPSAGANCLEYGSAKVTLTGVISERRDFGPPGYGEDPKHDSKEGHLYLKLDKVVCVSAQAGDNYNDPESGVTQMQMVYFTHLKFRKVWLGKHVPVTGTLFHKFSGHHWTAVLIEPAETHILPQSGT